MTLSKDFENIIKAWYEGVHTTDIYHMILDLFNNYKLRDIEEVKEILDRMNSNDSTQDIVEDFIYDQKYENLRKYLGSF